MAARGAAVHVCTKSATICKLARGTRARIRTALGAAPAGTHARSRAPVTFMIQLTIQSESAGAS
eukprot:COSAG02_NODE_27791_length_602_cov_1.242545_1_plen_63_part_10